MKPSKGRVVFFVMPDGDTRAADIVAVCNEHFKVTSYQREECQLQVKLDGENDVARYGLASLMHPGWRTSVPHDEETKAPGTWHWPPRV